jgi:PKD repeat protein
MAFFAFVASEASCNFERKLDGSGWLAVGSSEEIVQLNDGLHTYQVRAVDPAGNADPTPAVWTWTVDTSAPTAGTVNDGTGADIDIQASTTTISANWSGFSDLESGIAGYEWAIGTTPGGMDIQPFTNVGLATTATNDALALTNGGAYYVSVRATNAAGLQTLVTSDGVTVDNIAPTINSATATPTSGTAPFMVVFSVDATDVSGIAMYLWDFDGDGIFDWSSSASGTVSFTYSTPGTYSPIVGVIDSMGNSTNQVVGPIVVTATAIPGAALTAAINPPGDTTAPVEATFTVTNPPAGLANYQWDFDGDGNFDQITDTATTVFVYLTASPIDGFIPAVRLVYMTGSSAWLVGAPIIVVLPTAPAVPRITTVFKDMNGDCQYNGGAELIAFSAAGLTGTGHDPVLGFVGQRLGFIATADAFAGHSITQ